MSINKYRGKWGEFQTQFSHGTSALHRHASAMNHAASANKEVYQRQLASRFFMFPLSSTLVMNYLLDVDFDMLFIY